MHIGMRLERTCKCIREYSCLNNGNLSTTLLEFHKDREYQVDIYPLYYSVYQNGGWEEYVYLNKSEFNKYFRLIE